MTKLCENSIKHLDNLIENGKDETGVDSVLTTTYDCDELDEETTKQNGSSNKNKPMFEKWQFYRCFAQLC